MFCTKINKIWVSEEMFGVTYKLTQCCVNCTSEIKKSSLFQGWPEMLWESQQLYEAPLRATKYMTSTHFSKKCFLI